MVCDTAAAMKLLFMLQIAIGSFLLFLIQPILGKYIQPFFGGIASVWIACVMFFQLLLLAGYAYAHGMQRWSWRRQSHIHVGLLILSVLFVGLPWFFYGRPILLPVDVCAIHHAPIFVNVVIILFAAVGLPFFLLASTSSLTQAWCQFKSKGNEYYHLYGVSNAAAVLALLLYPFVIEVHFGLRAQAFVWVVLFAVYLVVSFVAAMYVGRLRNKQTGFEKSSLERKPGAGGRRRCLAWLLLSFCGSLFLLSVTTMLCQVVAPVPMMWSLPLVLYLLSFVVAFSSWSESKSRVWVVSLQIAVGLILLALRRGDAWAMLPRVVVLNAAMFLACMYCHATLYKLRPEPEKSTGFYLAVALGGALGGVFVSVLAPLVLNGYWELHIALLVASCFVPFVMHTRWRSQRIAGWIVPVLVVLLLLADWQHKTRQVVASSRNQYGALTVKQSVSTNSNGEAFCRNVMYNGAVLHGVQLLGTKQSRMPGSYYGVNSGVGRLLLLDFPDRVQNGEQLDVGVIGLGVGTLAAYGMPGDSFTFYEINPDVISYAKNTNFFRYVQDCSAGLRVVCGDGLLELKRENRLLDVLIIDAFNGGAIPAHLLTREAFEVYLARLNERGVIAWHASNQYVDFVPLAKALADALNLYLGVIDNRGDMKVTEPSRWILLSRDKAVFNREPLSAVSRNIDEVKPVPVWTDDYSTIMPLLKSAVFRQ